MKKIGFSRAEVSPCIFVHKNRGIACSIHGDDFTSMGAKVELDWVEGKLEGKYELRKGGQLGPGADDAKELTVLNRVLRYTEQGFCRADPALLGVGLTCGVGPKACEFCVESGMSDGSE